MAEIGIDITGKHVRWLHGLQAGGVAFKCWACFFGDGQFFANIARQIRICRFPLL